MGCNNFLDSGDFKEQLEKDIAYANARSISIIISPEEGCGSTIPAGSCTVKQGYPFEVSFTEASGYSFVKWIAVSKENSSKIIEGGVVFENEASPKTNATVKIDSNDIRIIPLCSDRISVSGEPNPKYDANGVSRDRSIIVEFTKVPAKSSFIFSHSEVPEGAEPLRNEDGEIWAYKKENGEVFLKNILITNADGYSLADHFTQPVLDEKLLTIAVDKKNPIEFEAGVLLKTILVTLSENISDTDGVCMTAEKSWRYQISEVTDEKATVGLTCDSKEGSVYLAGSKDYSIGQKITLSFTENADYQFIKWEYDENFVHIADEKSIFTTATVINKTDSEATVIKAVCAPRLRVKEFSPEGGTSRTSSKNSSVILKFSHDLPDDSEGKAQLSNIMITVGGSPVKSSFLEPVISGDTLSFSADKSNMLDVATGQTKTVTVSVPADFYYLLEDGTKVTYGGNGISFDYKIDETTLDKAEVIFASNSGSGIITTSVGSPAGTNTYSEGQEITITFNPSSDWQFNGWSISAGGNEVSEDKIRISDKSSPVAKLTVCEAVQGVTVKAEASEKLSVSSTSPNAEKNAKDSSIEIKFNKTLDSACSDLLSSVKVSMDGVNADSYFANRSLNENKITLTNTRHLSVAEGAEKTVTVTVPNSFYYIDGSVKVALEQDYSFTFTVDGTSAAKAEVTFSQTANAGTVSPAAETTQKYSLDTEVPISFVPASGWQFNGWSILDSNKNEVDSGEVRIADKNSASTTMHVYGEAKGLTVRANASEKLSVTGTLPSAQSNPKDSSISINFNKTLDSACSDMLNKIKISLDGVNVDSSFNKRSLNGNKITLTNTKYLNVTGNENKTVTVTVPNTFFYMDGSTKVSLPEEYTFEYTVNSSSNDKAQVSFNVEATGSGTINQTGEGGYSMGSAVALKFNIDGKYQFNGWTITDSEGKTVGEDKIKIENPSSVSTTMYVYQAVQGVTVNAGASEKLSIKSTVPSAQVNPKDSSISINFNKPLDSVCENLISDIKISMDGSNVGSFFAERKLNAERTTITLKNTKILNVTGSEEKTVTVTLPSTFFYKDGDIKVSLEKEYSFDYKINSTTDKKATVTYKNFPADSGDISPSGTKVKYSIGETVGLTFNLKDGYKFTGWTVKDSEGNDLSSIKIDDASLLSTKITFTDEVDDAIVRANAVLVPAVTSVLPAYSNAGVECDTPIVITFNKAVDQNTVKLASDGTIQIVDSGNENEHYESKFKSMDWDTDGKTLTIRTDRTIQTLVPSETDLKALKIKVIYAQIKDPDGNPLEKDPSCVYKINGKMEKDPPEVTMNLYKQGFDIQKDSAGEYAAIENGSYTALSASEFSTFAANDYPKNHVGKKIYFDATATDSGSGYKQLTIQETLIKTVDAAVTNQACKPSEPYTAATITKQVYELQSTMDGAVQLDFIFEDWAGNKTTKSWYVIKDTTIADTVVEKDNQNYILTSKWQTSDKVSDTQRPIYYYLNHELTNDYVYSRVADSTENYKEIIKFSKTDNYYSGRSEYADYVIKWGYSENNITNTADKEFDRVFSFTRSIKDTCFVKIICYDVVGNTKTLMVKIPKKTQLTGFDSGTFYGFTYYKPTYMNKADNAVLFYKYKENEDSELSEIRYFGQFGTSENSVISMPDFMTEDYYFKDETLTPDGIYYFYIIPYYEYGSIRYYGTVSKPYIYYHNVDNLSQNLQIPAFPTTFSYSINDEKPDSSGVRHIKISLPESFEPTPGYTYGVSFGSRGSLNEFDFTVSSGKKYQTYIGAVDANGNFYNSDYNVLIDATYDNIPPNWDEKTNGYISNYFSAPNEILIGNKWGGSSSWFPYDSGSGLKQINRNGSDLNVFNYYYTKFETTLPDNKLEHFSNEVVLNISREELKNLEKNTLEYDPTASQIKLEFNQSVEGYYFLILELEDKKGNYSILSGFVSNMVVAKLPKLTVSGTSTSDYTITIDTNSLRGWSYKLLFDNCYLSDDEWTIQNRLSNSNSSYNLKIKYDFLRIALNGKRNSLYAFYNPEYYIKQNAGENPVCNSKAVIPGLGGSYQVFYDAPCFAHTMAFPTNMLSDLDAKLEEAKSIDSSVDDETYIKAIWETKGREYGLKLINSSWLTSASTATYTAPISEIPSDYSYVTVFHFADGTSVMSEVKSK